MSSTSRAASVLSKSDQWATAAADDRAVMIMDVAARLFRERGFDAVSIRDLGSALGMSSSTLYHYFQNKQEILYAITRRFMSDFNEALIPLADGPAPARERLCLMIAEHIRFVYRRRNDLLISTHFRMVLDEEQRAHIVALMRDYRHAIRVVIEEGIEEGSFKITDADLYSRLVLDLTNAEREWFWDTEKWSVDDIAEACAVAALRICNDTGEIVLPSPRD